MSFKNTIITIGKDFRFWVLLFFILRLYGITNPPLEAAHNWRQTLTCSIARNFYEEDTNILYPRIDIDGEKSGIIASEFPVFNYLSSIKRKGCKLLFINKMDSPDKLNYEIIFENENYTVYKL